MTPEQFRESLPHGTTVYTDVDGVVLAAFQGRRTTHVNDKTGEAEERLLTRVTLADSQQGGECYVVDVPAGLHSAAALKVGDVDLTHRYGATEISVGNVADLARHLNAEAMGVITADGTGLVTAESAQASVTEVSLTVPHSPKISVAVLGSATLYAATI